MPPPPPHQHVRVSRRPDGVAHVVLDRPDKLNALTLPMLDELVRTARGLRRDDTVRAVVLTGEGDAFCAGLDLRAALGDPVGIGTRFVPRPWRGTNVFQEACWAWRRLPVPVVAAVHGHCLGAGIQLALGADLRTTTPDASWSVREVRWGLVPDMTGTRSLAELVGLDVAQELTLTGRLVPGSQARELGLATRVGADPVALAHELIAPMLEHDPRALAAAKGLLRHTWTSGPRATFARERRAQVALLRRLAVRSARGDVPGRRAPTR
ncbi:crotonase/enoyl-CoA hydratase family protein [uncultured Serinicoccus sp.]|uniref:crotonase/enoyl-CoA hydratase family protein n=1 Tax=uncultured Serinicoccus sp. TaxID=735514 RepID=UPI002626EDB2|nr:crotonase/enoyl-CoA hydratase family protein [uncultured Serinicoccus sp.]